MGSLFKSKETSAYMVKDGSQRRNFDDGNRHGGRSDYHFRRNLYIIYSMILTSNAQYMGHFIVKWCSMKC